MEWVEDQSGVSPNKKRFFPHSDITPFQNQLGEESQIIFYEARRERFSHIERYHRIEWSAMQQPPPSLPLSFLSPRRKAGGGDRGSASPGGSVDEGVEEFL